MACHGLGARCAVKPSRPLTASTRAGGRSRRSALSGGGRAALREARIGSPLCAGAAAAGAAAAGAAAGARIATSGSCSVPSCECQASVCAKPVFTRAATHGRQADAGCLGAAARAAGRGRATRTRTGAEAGRPGRAAPMTPHCVTATGALFCPDARSALAALRFGSVLTRLPCFHAPRLVPDTVVSLPWACSAQAAHVTHQQQHTGSSLLCKGLESSWCSVRGPSSSRKVAPRCNKGRAADECRRALLQRLRRCVWPTGSSAEL